MKKPLSIAPLVLAPATALAHSGHAHAPAESLSGVLHTLMTNPILFGVVGLLLVGVLLYRRQ